MYLCLNNLTSKYWKKNCPKSFIYTVYSLKNVTVIIFPFFHSYFFLFPLLVSQQISSFIL